MVRHERGGWRGGSVAGGTAGAWRGARRESAVGFMGFISKGNLSGIFFKSIRNGNSTLAMLFCRRPLSSTSVAWHRCRNFISGFPFNDWFNFQTDNKKSIANNFINMRDTADTAKVNNISAIKQ